MNFEFIKNKVFETLEFAFDGKINFGECDKGFKVSYSNGEANVYAENTSAACRALCEFAKAVTEGKSEFEISKTPHFTWCGPMLDMSREGVLRVERVKKYIDMIACLGMNMLMLYTEDVYEMEGYPFFGYKRGRYTLEELREMDDYAYSLGVELIPCIQTLGHLESYLCWAEAGKVKDTRWSILPGAEESLKFVEDMLKTCKKAFRSNNIHIGMDEAVWVGTGEYYKKHKNEVIDQKALLFDHLKKVCSLCKEYDYKPIIWSDLFFEDPETGVMYTENARLPEEYKCHVPDNATFMYWDYDAQKVEKYEAVMENHKETGAAISFAGSGWSFECFTAYTDYAFKTNGPGLRASINKGCDMVLNTLWGNGGCENSYFTCFPSNALYSEYMWSGLDATDEAAWEMSEFLTKTPKKLYDAADTIHYNLPGWSRFGRKLLRTDVFETMRALDTGYAIDSLPDLFHNNEPANKLFEAADVIGEYIKENGDWEEYFAVFEAALRTTGYKAYIHENIFKAYKEDDRTELRKLCNEILPACRKSYEKLYKLFSKQWKRDFKAFGWEWHCQHVGFMISRIDYAIDELSEYLAGNVSYIEELATQQLNQNIPLG